LKVVASVKRHAAMMHLVRRARALPAVRAFPAPIARCQARFSTAAGAQAEAKPQADPAPESEPKATPEATAAQDPLSSAAKQFESTLKGVGSTTQDFSAQALQGLSSALEQGTKITEQLRAEVEQSAEKLRAGDLTGLQEKAQENAGRLQQTVSSSVSEFSQTFASQVEQSPAGPIANQARDRAQTFSQELLHATHLDELSPWVARQVTALPLVCALAVRASENGEELPERAKELIGEQVASIINEQLQGLPPNKNLVLMTQLNEHVTKIESQLTRIADQLDKIEKSKLEEAAAAPAVEAPAQEAEPRP